MTETLRSWRWRVDVETATDVWSELIGLFDFNAKVDATMKDSSDYSSDGWGSDEKTFQKWSIEASVYRKQTADVQDATHLFVLAAEDQFGADGRITVRWYDKDGTGEAYSGSGTVQVERVDTAVDGLEGMKITISGYGPRTAITNPAGDPDPVIGAITPSTAADGALITITGTNLTGATAISFGGTAATLFTVINDNTISVVVPTLTSGTKATTVTTPEGTSASVSFVAP